MISLRTSYITVSSDVAVPLSRHMVPQCHTTAGSIPHISGFMHRTKVFYIPRLLCLVRLKRISRRRGASSGVSAEPVQERVLQGGVVPSGPQGGALSCAGATTVW